MKFWWANVFATVKINIVQGLNFRHWELLEFMHENEHRKKLINYLSNCYKMKCRLWNWEMVCFFFSHRILDWNRVGSGNFQNSYDKLETPLLTASVEFFCKKNAKEEKKLVKCILYDWIDFCMMRNTFWISFDFFFHLDKWESLKWCKKIQTSILNSNFHYSHRLRTTTYKNGMEYNS